MSSKKLKNEQTTEEITMSTTSRVLENGGLAEMAYIPKEERTFFIVFKDGVVKEIPAVILNEYEQDGVSVRVALRPFSPFNEMVARRFIKFPTGCQEYENEQVLFEKIKTFIKKYVEVPDDFSTVTAAYVMMSWLYDKFQTLPYLRVVGMFGTGKSRFLKVAGSICYKPFIAGGSISMAGLYRTINDVNGTFVFDEADFRSSDMSSEIIKILNGGHTKGMPVIRMEAEFNNRKFKTKVFEVFGPKILGSREEFVDKALESRCLTQVMFPQEKVSAPVHLPESFDDEATEIRNQLLAFRFKFYGSIKVDEATLPKKLTDNRLKQSALALTAVADIIGNGVLKQIHSFLKSYEMNMGYDDISDPKGDVVKSIVEILAEKQFKCGKLRITAIADRFRQDFYDEYIDRETQGHSSTEKGSADSTSYSYSITPRKIGAYIKKLNIRTLRDGHGYYIPVLQEYWKIKGLARRYGFTKKLEMPDEVLPDEVEEDDGKISWPEEGFDRKNDTPKVDHTEAEKEFYQSIGLEE